MDGQSRFDPICSMRSIPFGCTLADKLKIFGLTPHASINATRPIKATESDAMYWWRVLHLLHYYQVTDSRDKVSGVLGLVLSQAREQLPAQFPIDSKNKTTSDVYTETAIYLLTVEKTLSMYEHFPMHRNKVLGSTILGT
jgi:hypothetical protein